MIRGRALLLVFAIRGLAVSLCAGLKIGKLPLSGSVPGQAGWGLEQPGLVEGVPAHGRGLKLDDL